MFVVGCGGDDKAPTLPNTDGGNGQPDGSSAAPHVIDLGAGGFLIDGASPVGDAARVIQVVVIVSVVDSTQPGLAILQIAYASVAPVTRNPNGPLSYAHTMAEDRALPILPGTLRYRAAVILQVANPRSFAGSESIAIIPNAAVFNASP